MVLAMVVSLVVSARIIGKSLGRLRLARVLKF